MRETDERSKQHAETQQARDRKQAEAKAAFRVEQDKMVAHFKDVGIIKPCVNCAKDQWSSDMMALSGRKIENAADESVLGMFENIFASAHSATVMTCLVLTCGNCGAVQFFNMAPFAAALEKTKTDTAPAAPHLP
jgi:hypothetical protein